MRSNEKWAALMDREKVTKNRLHFSFSSDCAHVTRIGKAKKKIRKLVPHRVGGYDAVIANSMTLSDEFPLGVSGCPPAQQTAAKRGKPSLPPFFFTHHFENRG